MPFDMKLSKGIFDRSLTDIKHESRNKKLSEPRTKAQLHTGQAVKKI